MDVVTSVPALADRVRTLIERDPSARVVVGIVGEPGSGKSTIADGLAQTLLARGTATVVVPMDGFHLANVELARLGLADRKGAPDTFDSAGYAALLHRLHTSTDETVYAPVFDRSIEEPVAGAIPVPGGTSVVVTEGNYLLLDSGPWLRVRDLLDLSCAVEVDPVVRTERLRARHVRFGRSPAEAAAWVDAVDEPNAALARHTFGLADLTARLA